MLLEYITEMRGQKLFTSLPNVGYGHKSGVPLAPVLMFQQIPYVCKEHWHHGLATYQRVRKRRIRELDHTKRKCQTIDAFITNIMVCYVIFVFLILQNKKHNR